MQIKGYLRTSVWIYCILLTIYGSAQNPRKIVSKGIKYFEKGNYVGALDHLHTLDSSHIDNQVASVMGLCYLNLYQPQRSLEILNKMPRPDSTIQMALLQTYIQLERFDQATRLLANMSWLNKDSLSTIKKSIGHLKAFYDNKKGVIVQNFGPEINTARREYNSVSFNHYNNLLFTMRDDKDGKCDVDGMSYESMLETTINPSNNWGLPIKLNTNLEKERRHDATVQVYANGKRMITYHHGKLYTAILNDSTWQLGEHLRLHKKGGIDTHCFIDDDENFLIFASDYLSNGKDLDIFFCRKMLDGSWSVPEPIAEINTPYDEDAPFLAKDSTLYFSSRGHNSIGGYDIFKTTYNKKEKRWNDPVNLGYPINTVAEDTYYSTHGTLGYLTSSRKDGFGSLDLYRLFLFNMVEIKGKVVDDQFQTPLPNVEIDLSYDSVQIRSYTDIDGHYKMFMPIQKVMNVRFVQDTLNLYEGQYMINVFFKDEMNNDFTFQIGSDAQRPKLVGDLEASKDVKQINIDIKSDFTQNPFIATVSEKHKENWVDSLNSVYQNIRASASNSDPFAVELFYKSDSYELTDYHKNKLDSILATNKLNTDNAIIDIVGHADPDGPTDYNQHLSWRRANAAREYLNKKIKPSVKMIVRGLGESNATKTGMESQSYEKYRRVEIKFFRSNETASH